MNLPNKKAAKVLDTPEAALQNTQLDSTPEKSFATLAARFALAGHTLTRSNPIDGAVIYYASRWGYTRAFHDLQTAANFLTQIGGAA